MNIDCGVFIRSYNKDADWLDLCLRAYIRFCSGYNNIIVTAGKNWNVVQEVCGRYDIPFTRDDSNHINNGYVGQQFSKLTAHRHLDNDYILFVDSDCTFFDHNDPSVWFKNEKPIMLYDRWEDLGGEVPWKEVTRRVVGYEPSYEFMRSLPLLYPREVLVEFEKFIQTTHDKDILTFMKDISDHQGYGRNSTESISEFNALGAYSFKHHHEKFHWVRGNSEEAKALKVRKGTRICGQSWSRGRMRRELHTNLSSRAIAILIKEGLI
jgi:hypothetical protein